MADDGERLVSLEVHAEEAARQRDVIFSRLNSQDVDLRAIRDDVHAINEKLSNWRGFFSGVVFAIAALAGLVGAALTAAWTKFVS